jgi:ribosomal protein S18 acetylase RimI-like enzyme
MTAMIVGASHRRLGVGRRLVEVAVAHARNEGCDGIELTSGLRPEREAAHRFYEALGFERTSYRYWKGLSSSDLPPGEVTVRPVTDDDGKWVEATPEPMGRYLDRESRSSARRAAVTLGTGTALLQAAVRAATAAGCARVWLITTNDNLTALRFYQRRGFRLVAVHAGAVEAARGQKPSIPTSGEHGISLRDELQLELPLEPGLR